MVSNKKITGQKSEEILFSDYEKQFLKSVNPTINKLPLENLKNINLSNYKQIKKLDKIDKVHNFISKLIKGYSYKKNQVEVSKII